ncbi:cytochrome P450 3A24-like [Centruroides vittatus]|uniref:cytochrome P450 3A24-like n=1 Tax=Centruroides vittatus TaxID=120091 RepID=UPI00350ED3BB
MYLSMAILFSLFICVTLLWIRRRKWKMTLFQRYGILGPKPNFFIGNLNEFNNGREKRIEEWLQQYGKIFGFYLGAIPYVVCADVEFLKLIQIKDNQKFYNKYWILPDAGFPHNSSRTMLSTIADQKWKNLRNTLTSCFSTGKIKMMSSLMSRPINIFLKNLEKQGDRRFDIANMCKRLVFDIICTSVFGIITDVQNNETNTFIESAHAAFSTDTSDALVGISICFPEVEPLCSFLRYKIDNLKHFLNLPSWSTVYETCQKVINARKKLNQCPQDLLQRIIDAEDESNREIKKLSDRIVIANAMMFMAAGYDTTSSTLQWCIYHLACNPEIQQKVNEEIKSNVLDDENVQYADLGSFQLLNQVISETLRLHPLTSVVVNRLCSDDYRYKDITIPKGSVVIVPVQVLQNDPAYWSQPEKFNPYRFSSEELQKIDSIIYQPFGAGHRICIGQRLAITILRLVLANLLRSFKLEIYENKEYELVSTFFINSPRGGTIIKATPLKA